MPIPEHLRAFDDPAAVRKAIYDNVLESVKKRFPVEDDNFRIELADVRYNGPQDFTLAQQKQALLKNRILQTPVVGKWRLIDKKTNQMLDEREDTVMNVPYYSNRGTFLHRGNEYSLVNQARLKPGAYVRRQKSGEVETHFNVIPGTGKGFRIQMDPASGVFKLNIGQSDIPLYSLMQAYGVSDKQLMDSWGPELVEKNMAKAKPTDIQKIYERFAGNKYDPTLSLPEQQRWVAENLPKFKLDPDVVAATLGLSGVDGVTPDVLRRATAKMLGVARGEEEPDERDSLLYASIYGPEDLMRERIDKDAGRLTKNLLFRVRRSKNLQPVRKGILDSYLSSLLIGSGLAMPLEETNPLSTLEQMVRITKLGEGGISSAEAVTDEARNVSNTQAGFIDPFVGPESEAVGVDIRAAYGAYKGRDGNIYGEFKDINGRTAYLTPAQVYSSVMAYPGELKSGKPVVTALYRGKIVERPRDEVQYEMPSMARMFSPNTNMNPMPTATQSARQFYGSKFWSQYMPLVKGEVPLVDSLMPDGKSTFSEHYGRKVGALTAQRAGTVTKVTDDAVTVTDSDGQKKVYELVRDLPFNRITALTYRPAVKVGDTVNPGDMVAHSNFTDARSGAINMGVNLKTAVIPAKGGSSYEDAYTISETAAKRLAAERIYGFDEEARHDTAIDRNQYVSLFPRNFTKEQFEKIGDDGIAKPGVTLYKGDPIILATGPKLLTAADAQLGKLHKALRNTRTDKAITWDYDYPGVVVDAAAMANGARVNVKATPPAQLADKLCYDPETEVLTRSGWKRFEALTLDDEVASLNPETHVFDYIRPEAIQRYAHTGRMYKLVSQQLDMLVTDNHKLFVQARGKNKKFELKTPDQVFGKETSHKKDGVWVGMEHDTVVLPGAERGHRWGPLDRVDLELPVDTYMMLLGMFLSEGNCINTKRSSTYGIEFTQIKPASTREMIDALVHAGFANRYRAQTGKFVIFGKTIMEHFLQFGHAHDKFIPNWVFELPPAQLRVLFKWLMWGDGHSEDGKPISYCTCSPRLADDIQRLCLHIGYAANIVVGRSKAGQKHVICGRVVTQRYDTIDVRIITKKLTPTVNHSHVKRQFAQTEAWVDYSGDVWCCTLPKWHTLYVRRNGKAYWSGNSTRSGLKGVIGKVVPADQMPRDPVTNEPYELVLNPMGVLSRVAASQVLELALGKVAKKTGKQIRLPQDPPPEGWAAWASKQLAAAGVSDKADIFDPETGKTIKGVGDGYAYISAFHHLADKKLSARGEASGYTVDQQPARGGSEGAKRFSTHDIIATLSHGAPEVLRDMTLIRGSRNDEYWKALKTGMPLPEPKQPFIYDKFLATMQAAGINLQQKGNLINLMPMTDRAIEAMSKGAIEKSDMVNDSFDPIEGGLFDPGKTGGTMGNRWTHIELAAPVPNPVMEEPIRRLLGFTKQQLRDVIAGRQEIDGATGGEAIKKALEKIDIDNELEFHKRRVSNVRGSNRDNSIKIVSYLAAAKKQGIHPSDWVISKIPVLPPQFRPVARLGSMALVPDINELYRDVISINSSIKELGGQVDRKSLAEDYEMLYDATAAALGLGDPITPEGASKRLKGAFRQVIGASPKSGLFQSKVISKPVDVVARGVITPEPSYDMDQVGIPEDAAWALYKDFVMRKLTQRGFSPVAALENIENKTPTAKQLLNEVMSERPVIADRAPTWHKFNFLAFWPHIVDGKTFRLNALVNKGFNADFDGNCVDFDSHINLRLPESLLDLFKSSLYTDPANKEKCMQAMETVVSGVRGESGYVSMPIGIMPRIGEPLKDRNGADVYQLPAGIQVQSYDHNTGLPCYRPARRFTVEHSCKCVEVKTNSRSVIVSDNESLCLFDHVSGGVVKASPAAAVGRFAPVLSKDITPFGTYGNRDFGWWIGMFISDGWCNRSMVGLAKLEDSKRDAFVRIAREQLSPNFTVYTYRDKRGKDKLGNSAKIHCNGPELAAKVQALDLISSGTGRAALRKRIPNELLLNGSEEFLWGLLSGLLDGDGSLVKNTTLANARFYARFNTSSPQLRDDLVSLLWRLGLRSTVTAIPPRGSSGESYAVLASSVDLYYALDRLSCVGAREVSVISEWKASKAPSKYARDRIPITQDELDTLCRVTLAAKERASYSMLRRYKTYATRENLLRVLRLCPDSLPELRMRCQSPVMWEQIESVTDAGVRDVFDLEVEDTKVFAVNNGLIIWDTMNFHVPVSDAAVKQVKEKMMASKNLFSLTDLKSARHTPSMEMSIGLYRLTRPPTAKPPRVFNTVAEAKAAYRRGDIDANDPIEIRE